MDTTPDPQLSLFDTEPNKAAARVAAKLGTSPAELAERVGMVDTTALSNSARAHEAAARRRFANPQLRADGSAAAALSPRQHGRDGAPRE